MKSWDIKRFSYEDLPAEINKDMLSSNGCGKEEATYLVLYLNGVIYDFVSDAMEPEDKTFNRDLDFIKDWIETIIKEMK